MGRALSENNRRQAQFPRGATVIPNPHGTAPGFEMALPRGEGLGDGSRARFVFVPGVPHEAERMLDERVIPALEAELAAAGAGT
ncbi:MAG TPA: hypothetical protein VHF22_14825, partial [Planctomycetota bacterium]|nr:hypothetical protein [Planctomycetota bacterium]